MKRPLLGRGTAVVALAVLAGCSGGEEPAIQVAPVTRGDVTEVVEAPGTVTARATALLTAPADGRVERLAVDDGMRVRAGQVLLVIDSPAARDALAQAEQADREAAAAADVQLPGVSIDDQQRRAGRAAALGFAQARKAAQAIPDPALRAQALTAVAAAEADYAAAQAQARDAVRRLNAGIGSVAEALGSLSRAQRVQTRAAVAVARRTVDALTVRAPISGVVSFTTGGASAGGGSGEDLSGALSQLPQSLRGPASSALGGAGPAGAGVSGPLSVGLVVRAGAPLLTVTDVSTLAVTAEVDETDVLLVRPGVPADVELDAVPGATYDAKVAAVSLAPTTSSRGGVAYAVRLALAGGTDAHGEPAARPRPGMSSVVSLRVRAVRGVVTVPASAVFRDGAKDAVWAVGSDGALHKREVLLGAQGEALVEVREGVNPGDRVVVRGADRVTEGQRLP